MNIETITMTEQDAKIKLAAYKKRLASLRHTEANKEVAKEYAAAIQGYKALTKGHKLIDLEDVFNNCPRDEKHRPRLAIARADVKQVKFIWRGNENIFLFRYGKDFWSDRDSRSRKIVVNEPNRYFPYSNSASFKNIEGFALVPMIPADILPERINLSESFILWEVEKWADREIGARPSPDPYLLKHIGGPLYAVIAEWDLTPLELSITKGRQTK